MDDGLACRIDDRDGVVMVQVVGVLSTSSSLTVSRTVRKHLLDRGRVLVDVSGMRVAWPPSVTVFPTVLASVGGWPGARMVLFGATAELAALLRSTATTVAVPHAEDRVRALALLEQ